MAFNADAVWSVTYTLRDNNGKTSPLTVNFAGAWTVAQLETRAAGLAPLIASASDAYLASYSIQRSYLNDAPDPKNDTSEVERKLLIQGFVGPRVRTSYQLPSPVFSMEQDDTDKPDPSNAALNALLAYLHDGSVGFSNGPTDSLGNSLTSVKARRVFHRKRKAQ